MKLKEAMIEAKRTGKRVKVTEPDAGPHEIKVNVSIRLDLEVLNWLKAEATKQGLPYTTLANSLLKKASTEDSLEERVARIEKVIRKQQVG